MDVRLLGSGGWMPTDRRETACVYLRDGADVLLLDAGTGLRRLVTDPELLDGVERLHVALTHFHHDHVFGLVALPALTRVAVREVWAPGLLVAGRPADEVVRTLLGPPYLAATADEVTGTFLTGIHELDGPAEIGPFRLETRVQPLHTCATVALRVGRLAYCTDTAYDPANAAFARGADVLLHEAVHPGDETDDPIHSSAGEAARIAAAAGVSRLVLCHLSPTLVDTAELLGDATPHFPDTVVGSDGLSV
jgi:ribonuclease BN (tRNA processing enzyme)